MISRGGEIYGKKRFQALTRENTDAHQRPFMKLSSRSVIKSKQVVQHVMIEKAMAETYFVRRNPGSQLIIEHRNPNNMQAPSVDDLIVYEEFEPRSRRGNLSDYLFNSNDDLYGPDGRKKSVYPGHDPKTTGGGVGPSRVTDSSVLRW